MNQLEIEAKLEKAKTSLQKKRLLIEKKKGLLLSCSDYEKDGLRYDLRRLDREVTSLEGSVERYNKQIGNLKETEAHRRELPEILNVLAAELREQWNEFDLGRLEKLKAARASMTYKEFRGKYTAVDYSFSQETEERIIKRNERAAADFVLNLFLRVRHITGEVQDWKGISVSGPALNGLVVGRSGRANVKTIVAGGYNIQRLNLRVLVKPV